MPTTHESAAVRVSATRAPRGVPAARPAGRLVRSRWLVAGLVAAAAVGAPRLADAFCRSTTCTGTCARDPVTDCKIEGYPLYWSSLCVPFALQQDGSINIAFDEVVRVTQNSFVAWTDLDCGGGFASLSFARMPDVAPHVAEYIAGGANTNVIMFQDYRWEYTGEGNTLGKATVTYDNDTGEILDADIELNHAYNEFTTGDVDVVYDLQSILTHEIGHFNGLDHTTDFYATMNSGYQQGTIDLRTLEADDITGMCAVYPPGRPGVCALDPPQAESEGGCSLRAPQTRSPGHETGWSALCALVTAVGLRIVRRRRPRHARRRV